MTLRACLDHFIVSSRWHCLPGERTYLPLNQSQVNLFLMFGKCSPGQIQGSYLTVCVKPSGNVTGIWGARDLPGEDKEGRRSRPTGAKGKYCSAFRISGPPPPRQAAGDPSAVSTKVFNPRQRFFLRTGLPEPFVYGRFRTRIQMGSVGALSWTSVFNFDVVD